MFEESYISKGLSYREDNALGNKWKIKRLRRVGVRNYISEDNSDCEGLIVRNLKTQEFCVWIKNRELH